jgi:uncharacterized protein involved in exopolysaccharide biosynthesis
MSKRDILVFLFKRKYTLIGYFLFTVAAVTAFVYLMPQKYKATAVILIESNRAPVMRADPEFGVEEGAVINSAIAVMSSRTVLAAAIDKVGVSEREPESDLERFFMAIGDWMVEVGLRSEVPPREAAIEGLRDGLEIEPRPGSSVIAISLKGIAPEATAATVNAVTDAYIAHHLKVYSAAGTGEVLRQQLDRLAQELDGRREELRRYKQQGAVSALGETRQALTQMQANLSLDMGRARSELAEAELKFGASNPRVTIARERIDNLQEQINEASRKLRALESQESRIRDMELGISAAERSYQEYQRRYEEQRLGALSNPDVVNVRVIEYASVPVKPDHSRLFYIILGIGGGAILALAIAVIKEYFDHRVTDPDAIQELLGLPALGSLERA